MKMQQAWRTTIISVVVAMAAIALTGPLTASADPPTSAVTVDSTTVQQGETFTVTETIFNPRDFTVTFAKPTIYAKELSIVSFTDLVSCTNTTIPCFAFGASYRAPVGDLPPGESRTVTITLRVKDDAPVGPFTLQHQFVGDNFSFDILDGPVITITGKNADIAVGLDASPRGILTATVNYTVAVTNTGPANATAIRVTSTYPAGLTFGNSSECTRVPNTRTVICDIPALATGASTTAHFSAHTSLLALGQLTTRSQRTQSAPTDPNPANDTATKTCTAVTGLLVIC